MSSRSPEIRSTSEIPAHVHAISMPSACHQQSTTISGNPRSGAPTDPCARGRHSSAISDHQRPSTFISSNQRPSVALSRTQSHSVAITRAGRRHAHSPQQLDRRPLRKTKRPPRPRPPLPCLARRWGAVRGSRLIHLANEGQLGAMSTIRGNSGQSGAMSTIRGN